MTNKPMPEPFSYFKAGPFGWTDCAETDQGAIPLYDAAIVYAYAKTCAEAEAKRIFDEGMTTVGHMREQIAKAVEAEREAFRRQVANDAYAITFQTSGQYRTALLQFIRERQSHDPR